MMRVRVFLALLGAADADVYMQYPPGSNNRLAEGGGNRNNNNRLMDTQNNAKGGYGYGGNTNNPGQDNPVTYMAGSKLSMAWTSQHSCGSENAECQIVVQYMCGKSTSNAAPPGVAASTGGTGEGPIRDGTNGNTPDPNNPSNARGLHEPTSFYQSCDNTQRNKGLYTADQNVNRDDARGTRQNPNGARSGLECPEERDYYPYWRPSPWKDAMILTNNLRLCREYQKASQNVAARGYCTQQGAPGNNNLFPWAKEDCPEGSWVEVPAFGLPPPECVAAPFQRDNHLGSGPTGHEVFANLTIPGGEGGIDPLTGNPDDAVDRCVYRLRYNITTGDTRACSNKQIKNEADCEAAGEIWSSYYLDSDYNDDAGMASTTPPLPQGNPKANLGGALSSGGGTDSLLELAVNTNQYGRTFQDRTHVFGISARPPRIGDKSSQNIYNLNVKGKRGNIVQTYPATEYDFHPVDLVVGKDDLVHVQWTGNDNTNNNGNNNGEGTNNEDRHNIVQISSAGLDVPLSASEANMFDVEMEWNPEPPTSQFGGSRAKDDLVKQFALVKQTNCNSGEQNNDQDANNCEKLNAAAHTINLGLIKFKPGNYTYMSSRNNNFSNRAQKAKLNVLTTKTAPVEGPVNVQVKNLPSASPDIARMELTWAPPGAKGGETDLEGNVHWGADQAASGPAAYLVHYTVDGGNSWIPYTRCQSSARSCVVDPLPAGKPVGFRVHSYTTAGYGPPSETVIAKTFDSPASLACEQQLIDNMSGEYLSAGSIVAIVLGVFAGVFALAFGCFMVRRRQPPPPPPPGMMKEMAPPGPGGYA